MLCHMHTGHCCALYNYMCAALYKDILSQYQFIAQVLNVIVTMYAVHSYTRIDIHVVTNATANTP